MILDIFQSAYRKHRQRQCEIGNHVDGNPEPIFERQEYQADAGGDWPQTYTAHRFVRSGRVKIQCRHCDSFYIMSDIGNHLTPEDIGRHADREPKNWWMGA